MLGIEAFLQILADAGVRQIFGNPGTTELPLTDALAADDRFRYILGLQEVPVMAMADGFAMASGQPAVVNLHISPGLGNAMGMLYNAYREGSPLIVTAGQQDRRLKNEEPILWGELVEVAKPWTKWAAEVQRVEDVPIMLRRALQTALSPPTGPVFLSLPIDVQSGSSDGLDLTPFRMPDVRVRPPLEAVRAASECLLAARQPVILAGSRITDRHAMDELVAVAEVLGAPVYYEPPPNHGRMAFPCDHELNAHALPMWSPDVLDCLEPFDVALVVGQDLLRQYVYHEPSCPIPPGMKLIHFDENPWQLGKNYPLEVGVLGDIREGLAELATLLNANASTNYLSAANVRRETYADKHGMAREQLREQIQKEPESNPVSPISLMSGIADILPANAIVVEEAVTTTGNVLERLGAIKDPTGYFGHRGWGLGWGLGCAIGAKLAWPDRPALAILGDGASLYGIQGLWSAAHYRIPVTFLICNNSQYEILKDGSRLLGLPQASAGRYLGMEMTDPSIDFVKVAEGFGVEGIRASSATEAGRLVAEGLAASAPRLIEVAVQRGS